jgi:hypothetical protein
LTFLDSPNSWLARMAQAGFVFMDVDRLLNGVAKLG